MPTRRSQWGDVTEHLLWYISEAMSSIAHSEAMPSSAQSKAMPSSAYYYQPISLNNKHVRQRQHCLKGSKSYRLVAISWGLTSSAHSVWINTINTAILKTPVVSEVRVTQGKQKHRAELGQKYSRERRKMRFRFTGGNIYLWGHAIKAITVRTCHRALTVYHKLK